MDILTVISVIVGLFSLLLAYKMYHHSYRGIDFQLDQKNYATLLSAHSREKFSGLRNLNFYFVNKGAKPIIIDKFIVEKQINKKSLSSVEKKGQLTINFFILYHFFVSENLMTDRLTASYQEESNELSKRKYNILELPLTINPSEKKVFTFSAERQLRHLLYTFDERINSFMISDLYVQDTLGNTYRLPKKQKNRILRSSIIDSYIISFYVNACSNSNAIKWMFSCELQKLYFFHLSKKRSVFSRDINFSVKAMSSYLKEKDSDFSEDIEEALRSEDAVPKKDNELIFKSLQKPLTDEEIDNIRRKYNKNELTIEYLRKFTVKEHRKVEKAMEESRQAELDYSLD